MLTIAQKIKVLGAYTIKLNDVGHGFDITRRVTASEVGLTYAFIEGKIVREEIKCK